MVKSKYFINENKFNPEYRTQLFSKQFAYAFPKDQLYIYMKIIVKFNKMCGINVLSIYENSYNRNGHVYTSSYEIGFTNQYHTCDLTLLWHLLDIYLYRYSNEAHMNYQMCKNHAEVSKKMIKDIIGTTLVIKDLRRDITPTCLRDELYKPINIKIRSY